MTNPSGFVSNLILLSLEKCHCVKLLPDEVRRVRLASRELLRQGYVTTEEIKIVRLDDTPLTLNVQHLNLEVLSRLSPHKVYGEGKQTFYAYYSSTGDGNYPQVFWFPSKRARNQFVGAYSNRLATAVKKSDIPARLLREAVKGY